MQVRKWAPDIFKTVCKADALRKVREGLQSARRLAQRSGLWAYRGDEMEKRERSAARRAEARPAAVEEEDDDDGSFSLPDLPASFFASRRLEALEVDDAEDEVMPELLL